MDLCSLPDQPLSRPAAGELCQNWQHQSQKEEKTNQYQGNWRKERCKKEGDKEPDQYGGQGWRDHPYIEIFQCFHIADHAREQVSAFVFHQAGGRERFELLEETLQMAHAMWSGGSGSGDGFSASHVQATRLLNSPQAISRPRVPIMIGGGGERKTLRLVAQYADACNVFGGPERIAHKYAVLREHCERLGRPYEEIERSTLQSVDLDRESVDEVVERFGALGEAGAQHVLFSLRGVNDLSRLERIGAEVLPQLR